MAILISIGFLACFLAAFVRVGVEVKVDKQHEERTHVKFMIPNAKHVLGTHAGLIQVQLNQSKRHSRHELHHLTYRDHKFKRKLDAPRRTAVVKVHDGVNKAVFHHENITGSAASSDNDPHAKDSTNVMKRLQKNGSTSLPLHYPRVTKFVKLGHVKQPSPESIRSVILLFNFETHCVLPAFLPETENDWESVQETRSGEDA
jgi:hypothetical protein